MGRRWRIASRRCGRRRVPPWSRWFGLAPVKTAADGPAAQAVARALAEVAETLQGHLDRSNFALEVHQAFLELVVTGTGILLVEEAPPGEASALRFTAVPLRDAVLEEGPDGRMDSVFRALRLTPAEIRARWPQADLPEAKRPADAAPPKLRVVAAARPDRRVGHRFAVVLEGEDGVPRILAEGRFAESPFIAFRWLKVPGVRWPPTVGQFDGLVKLGPGCFQAANLVASSAPYTSSGVCPPSPLWGRPAL